jgi:hypothetical protein
MLFATKEESDLEAGLEREVEKAGGCGATLAEQGAEMKREVEVKLDPKLEGKTSKKVRPALSLPLEPDSFRENALAMLSAELRQWNGPAQYLRANYQTDDQQSDFKRSLDQWFPCRPELEYHQSSVLPDDMDTFVLLRLSDLGFTEECSSKPAPFLHVSLALLDEFLTNSVLTRNDPVLLAQSSHTGELKFWTCFVKGSARACTLLFLASEIMKRDWDLQVLSPDLLSSMTAVWGRREIMATDSQSIALANAKLSQSGAIRKAHCVLTWLGKLCLLQRKGLNADQVIKTWNTAATDVGKLSGNRRVALLQLLAMPEKCVELLLAHLSEFGDKPAFFEDAFSNKRLAVGAKARAGNKMWNDRLTVTEDALFMMLQYVHAQHQKKLPGTHQKVRKDALEEILNMAQLLRSLVAELVAEHPIQQSILDDKVHHFHHCRPHPYTFIHICTYISIYLSIYYVHRCIHEFQLSPTHVYIFVLLYVCIHMRFLGIYIYIHIHINSRPGVPQMD